MNRYRNGIKLVVPTYLPFNFTRHSVATVARAGPMRINNDNNSIFILLLLLLLFNLRIRANVLYYNIV